MERTRVRAGAGTRYEYLHQKSRELDQPLLGHRWPAGRVCFCSSASGAGEGTERWAGLGMDGWRRARRTLYEQSSFVRMAFRWATVRFIGCQPARLSGGSIVAVIQDCCWRNLATTGAGGICPRGRLRSTGGHRLHGQITPNRELMESWRVARKGNI